MKKKKCAIDNIFMSGYTVNRELLRGLKSTGFLRFLRIFAYLLWLVHNALFGIHVMLLPDISQGK